MRKQYLQHNGIKFTVEHSYIEDGKVYLSIWDECYGYSEHHLKAYYRSERTWDDHMGNTPCGYYVQLPIHGTKKRVYLFQ